jgi:hypothetical protein
MLGPVARAIRKVETLVGRFVDLRNGCCDRRGYWPAYFGG